jgi:hypothetical protein
VVGTASKFPLDCWAYVYNDPEKSDRLKGIQVHRVIREQLIRHFRRRGYGERIPIQVPSGGYALYSSKNFVQPTDGTVDLAYRAPSKNVILVAEIKPANPEGFIEGDRQLENYLDHLNADDAVKRRLKTSGFDRLTLTGAGLPLPTVIWQGKYFDLHFCHPGLIFYKRNKRKEEKEKEKERQRAQQRARAQPSTEAAARATARPSAWRQAPAWAPAEAHRAIAANSLAAGVHRFPAPYLYGYRSDVLVWVERTPGRVQYQFRQEFPSEPGFYEEYARRRGLTDSQRRLVQEVLVHANEDFWSLIRPDRQDPRSILDAREELRRINDQIFRLILGGSAAVVAAGAGITGVSNAARSVSGAQRSLTGRTAGSPGLRSIPPPRPIPASPDNVRLFERVAQDLLRPAA